MRTWALSSTHSHAHGAGGVRVACAPDHVRGTTMLTTTLDGLWALQVLTGIEVLAPEMGLRPHLPSVEPKRLALDHPVAHDLRTAGVIDELGTVDGTVVE